MRSSSGRLVGEVRESVDGSYKGSISAVMERGSLKPSAMPTYSEDVKDQEKPINSLSASRRSPLAML